MLKNFTNRLLGQNSSKSGASAQRQEATDEGIATLINEFFHGAGRTANYSAGGKSELITEIEEAVEGIREHPKPLVPFRESVATWVVQFADFQVLCLTEAEMERTFYRDCPYVSGELYKSIRKLAPFNKELKQQMLGREDVTDAALLALCKARSGVALLHCNALNLLRKEIGDIPGSKDWFFAFMEAMLIWRENHYRSEAGMTTFVDGIRAMELSVYMNVVGNPANVNPRYTWETTFSKAGQSSNYNPGTVSDPAVY
jgi:hypothetical protein